MRKRRRMGSDRREEEEEEEVRRRRLGQELRGRKGQEAELRWGPGGRR